MKRLLLCLPLLLASCAPLVSRATGNPSSLTASASLLTFANGESVTAERVVVAADGITTADPRCTLRRDLVLVCRLGDVQGGQSAAITYAGTLKNANATYYAAGKLRGVVLSR